MRTISSEDGRMVLVDAGPPDRPAIIDIFQAAFGRWPPFPTSEGAKGFLDWALTDGTHFRGRSELCYYDGPLVAAGLHVERNALIDGASRLAQQGMYGALLPEYQGQGLGRAWTELGQQKIEDADFSWGFTQVAQLNHLRPQFFDDIPVNDRLAVFLRVMDASHATFAQQGLLRRAKYAGLRLLGRMRRRRAAATPGLDIGPAEGFTNEIFGPFWSAASAPFAFIPVRSAQYINWRFSDPRAGRFLLRAAWDGDELVGYAAVRVGTPRAIVADLLTRPDRSDVARALLDDATAAARAEGSGAVEIRLPARHPLVASALRAGFVRLPGRSAELDGKLHFTAKRLGVAEFTALDDPGMLMHLTAADSDLV